MEDSQLCSSKMKFNSQHEALDFIQRLQKAKQIKKCWRVGIKKYQNIHSPNGSFYEPICREGSFNFKKGYNSSFFCGCPENCHLYEYIWWGKFKYEVINFFQKIIRVIKRCGINIRKWFQSLPLFIKTIIYIIILVGVFGYPFIKKIVDLIISAK